MSFKRVQNYKSQKTANRPSLQSQIQASTSQKGPFDLTSTSNHTYYNFAVQDTLRHNFCPNSSKQTFDDPIFYSSQFLRPPSKGQSPKRGTSRGQSKKKSLKTVDKKGWSEQKVMQVKRMSLEQQAYSIIKKSIKKDLSNFILTAQQIQNRIDINAQKLNIKQVMKIHDFRKKIKQQMDAFQEYITSVIDQEQTKNTISSESSKRD